MEKKELHNKKFIISAAASGIGYAIANEIVQNGGSRKRKDDLRGLLYKTESRRNRTKKKGRKNERKKDRSLRKRI